MRYLGALLLLLILTLFPVPAQADQGCVVDVVGVKVCGTILNQPLPEVVTVTKTLPPLPPIRVPGPTVFVPGPTRTVTSAPRHLPGPTIYVPGPTRTVYSPGVKTTLRGPQPTMLPSPAVTTTKFIENTVTETQTASRRGGTQSGTIRPDGHSFISLPPVTLSAPEAVGVGVVSLLALVGLIMIAMYGGYAIGYKDKEKKDTNFMRALLDTVKSQGKHS